MWSCLGYHVHWKCLQLLFMAGAIFHFFIRHPTSLSALTKICQCTFMTPPVHSLSLLCRNSPVISPQSFILFSPISPHLPLFLLPCEMKSFHHLLTYRQHHMVYRWIDIQYNERGILVNKAIIVIAIVIKQHQSLRVSHEQVILQHATITQTNWLWFCAIKYYPTQRERGQGVPIWSDMTGERARGPCAPANSPCSHTLWFTNFTTCVV